jgi:hypothetical protein
VIRAIVVLGLMLTGCSSGGGPAATLPAASAVASIAPAPVPPPSEPAALSPQAAACEVVHYADAINGYVKPLLAALTASDWTPAFEATTAMFDSTEATIAAYERLKDDLPEGLQLGFAIEMREARYSADTVLRWVFEERADRTNADARDALEDLLNLRNDLDERTHLNSPIDGYTCQ